MTRIGFVSSLAALALVTACAAPRRPVLPWSSASPDPQVLNVTPARFAAGSGATEAVQTECDLPHLLPEWITQYSPVPIVLAVNPMNGARVLDLSVTSIMAPGGGTWSGAKQLVVHGDLIVNGTVVASFDDQRTALVGGWAAGGGTCEVLDYISESIAKDVRAWLSQPSQGALLGELR